MIKTLNINTFFKDYENLFDKFIDEIGQANTIKLISDLFISSLLLNQKKMKKITIEDFLLMYKDFLFIDYGNNPKPKSLFLEHFDGINDLVLSESNFERFEVAFGMILEKHINRKSTGSYYTPEDTTKFICWNSIFVSILNKLDKKILDKIYQSINITNNVEFVDKKLTFEEKIKIIRTRLNNNDLDIISNTLSKTRIIDPTCGSGAFILSAYDCISFLNNKLLDGRINSNAYFNNIYGVDNQEDAIVLCKTRVLIRGIVSHAVDDIFIKTMNKNFIVEDTLTGSDYIVKSNGKGLNWKKHDKYDCIIGNPPYVEVKNKEPYKHFHCLKCGNLYAYVIERSCNIIAENGIISFIVPLPFIATSRMSNIQKYLEEKSDIVYYSTFADRPGCLFTGVHQRLTIFFAKMGTDVCRRFTSSYNYWYNKERKDLFTSLDFIENNHPRLPKIGINIENSIYVKAMICTTSVFSLLSNEGKYPLYVSSRIGFWAKAFLEKPKTNEISTFYFDSDEERRIMYCIINSSYFYFMWVVSSDCWHITNNDLKIISFNFDTLSLKQRDKLLNISKELSNDLEKNKVRINSKQTEYEYKHKYSKKIIDKIDDIICSNVGLNISETKYIKSYTLKYRMNTVEGDI